MRMATRCDGNWPADSAARMGTSLPGRCFFRLFKDLNGDGVINGDDVLKPASDMPNVRLCIRFSRRS